MFVGIIEFVSADTCFNHTLPRNSSIGSSMKAVNASNLQKHLKEILASEETYVVVKYGKLCKMIVPFSGEGIDLQYIDEIEHQAEPSAVVGEQGADVGLSGQEQPLEIPAPRYDVDADRKRIVDQIMAENKSAEEHRFDKKPRRKHVDMPTTIL